MKAKPTSPIYAAWQDAGARENGTWEEVFGWSGGEFMNTWHLARYIDYIAAAGKAAYDIPLYINVWLAEQGFRLAGSYPAGGAVTKVLDIHRWATKSIDLVAPDIYLPHSEAYRYICAHYDRDDNPLYIPESGRQGSNAWYMFYALLTTTPSASTSLASTALCSRRHRGAGERRPWPIACVAWRRPPRRCCCATRAPARCTPSSRRRTRSSIPGTGDYRGGHLCQRRHHVLERLSSRARALRAQRARPRLVFQGEADEFYVVAPASGCTCKRRIRRGPGRRLAGERLFKDAPHQLCHCGRGHF
jgi:hypothetical protein